MSAVNSGPIDLVGRIVLGRYRIVRAMIGLVLLFAFTPATIGFIPSIAGC